MGSCYPVSVNRDSGIRLSRVSGYCLAGILAALLGSASTCLAAAPAAVSDNVSGSLATAEQAPTPTDASAVNATPGDIIVTARRREERLQDVPDSITAFSAETIQRSGIQTIQDVANLTPNVTFMDGSSFQPSDTEISLRGISNTAAGWPSVSLLIDGVPFDSMDALADGTLTDIERIEVLRGPQSALYGFNAIAGAINIVTSRPTNDFAGKAQGTYASGGDRSVLGTLSGPIVQDRLAFRVMGYLRNMNGLIRSGSNGRPVDPRDQRKIDGKLFFSPSSDFDFQLWAQYNDVTNGSTFQGKVGNLSELLNFSDALNPRRRLIGKLDYSVFRTSLRAVYHGPAFDVISLSSYSRTNQDTSSSACFDDPDAPIVVDLATGSPAGCLFDIPVYGSRAVEGQAVDQIYLSAAHYRTFFQDARIQYTGTNAFQWTVGMNLLERRAFNGFDSGIVTASAAGGGLCANGFGLDLSRCGGFTNLFPLWFSRRDSWWAVYGQASYDVTDALQLTVALRYDDQSYKYTQYGDHDKTAIVPTIDASGTLVDTRHQKASKFQPKFQLSYKFTPRIMAYAVYSEGFRAAYFNSGQFNRQESTKNYEGGLKSSFTLGGIRNTLNLAAFQIVYSDQQINQDIPNPPFVELITIPQTDINGFEAELTSVLSSYLTVNGALGYLDAKVQNGLRSPVSPRWTLMGGADLNVPLNDDLAITAHADVRYTSPLYLDTDNLFRDTGRTFVNLRAGVNYQRISLVGFVRNATDERNLPVPPIALPGAFVRYVTQPRQYGVQLSYTF